MEIELSIVVPVYNSSQYLSLCVDHLLDQGFSDSEYEIILVNDGSTDESLDICNNYAARHTNIRVFDQPNLGVSVTRNRGIAEAKGKMVCFVDSDDYIVKGSFGRIFEECYRTDADIIRFFIDIKEEADAIKTDVSGTLRYICTGVEFMERSGLETFSVCSFYSKDFLVRNQIKFQKLCVGEDFLFASTALLKAKKFVQTGYTPYVYVRHHGSSSTRRGAQYSRTCVSNCIYANNEIIRLLEEISLTEKQRIVAEETLRSKSIFAFSRVITAEYSRKEFKEVIRQLKDAKLLSESCYSKPFSFIQFIIWVVSHSYIFYVFCSKCFKSFVARRLY